MSKAGQLGRINLNYALAIFHLESQLHSVYYLSTSLVNAWNVDTGDELNRRRVVRVIGAAVDVDTVYPVLMDALPVQVSDMRKSTRITIAGRLT